MNGFVITLAHQKGGVGKSTLAAQISVELSKTHDTQVIDLDVQRSLTAFLHTRHKNYQDSIPSPKLIKEPGSIQELISIMDNVKPNQFLVIDTGGYDMDMQRVAMLGSDIILTPVSDSSMELHGLAVFLKTIAQLREHKKDLKASILINRAHIFATRSIADLLGDVNDHEEFNIMETIIRDRKAHKEVMAQGLTSSEHQYGKDAAIEIANLINEIKYIVGAI